MRKINIPGFKIGDTVLVKTTNPPVEGKLLDMYEVEEGLMPQSPEFKQKYGKYLPIMEIGINGKIISVIKDVVVKK